MRKQETTLYLEKEPKLSITVRYDYSPPTFGSWEDRPESEEIELNDITIEDGTILDLIWHLDNKKSIDYLTEKISEHENEN